MKTKDTDAFGSETFEIGSLISGVHEAVVEYHLRTLIYVRKTTETASKRNSSLLNNFTFQKFFLLFKVKGKLFHYISKDRLILKLSMTLHNYKAIYL